MQKLFCFLVLLSLVIASAPGVLHAQDEAAATRQFATVKLFFVNQYLPDQQVNAEPADGVLGGGTGAMAAARLRFEVARVFLDGKFIGHAMLRHVDVKPTLNLPPGECEIRIECDGYHDFKTKLEVLQHGSTQWLVIELEREETSSGSKVPTADVEITTKESTTREHPHDSRDRPSDAVEKGMKADELERRKRSRQRSEPDVEAPRIKKPDVEVPRLEKDEK